MEPLQKPINRQMRALALLEALRQLAQEHLTELEFSILTPAQWGARLGEKLNEYRKRCPRPQIPQSSIFGRDEDGRRYSVPTDGAMQVALVGDCFTRCVLCGTVEATTLTKRANGAELRNNTRCGSCRRSKV